MEKNNNRNKILDRIRTGLESRTCNENIEAEMPSQKSLIEKNVTRLVPVFEKNAMDNGIKMTLASSVDQGIERMTSIIETNNFKKVCCFPFSQTCNDQIQKNILNKLQRINNVIMLNESEFQSRSFRIEALSEYDCAITGVDYLVANPGILAMKSNRPDGRLGSLLVPHHIAIRFKNQIEPSLDHVFQTGKGLFNETDNFSCWTLIAGPSRTADIEKKLVFGVHGPLSVHLIVFDFKM